MIFGCEHEIMILQADIKAFGTRMQSTQGDTQLHLEKLKNNQRRLAKLYAQEGNIRTTLVSIQTKLLPPLEILKQELAKAKVLMKEDANISTEEGLVELVAKIEIQLKSLEIASNNWVKKSYTIT